MAQTIEIIGNVLTHRGVMGAICLVCYSALKGHCGYLNLIYQKMCKHVYALRSGGLQV